MNARTPTLRTAIRRMKADPYKQTPEAAALHRELKRILEETRKSRLLWTLTPENIAAAQETVRNIHDRLEKAGIA